jgi:hypothetical protein
VFSAKIRKNLTGLKEVHDTSISFLPPDHRSYGLYEPEAGGMKGFFTMPLTIPLMERKLRMPQIQGVQGRSRSNLLRALGNEGDGVSSTFPEGKQNGEKMSFYNLSLRWIYIRHKKLLN